ncbi:LysR family transcriptional regulator [Umezawaea tangerina]|uniref:DNA-binding transcriptional LysR family regulator n=1 Tax=Umezawaea tangerina TaxID=84725 RepID=A0A2T0SQP3_9PSEU|nr:LysR family transcriptional regulator [Umezawaea tangerina]PRY35730.1 DNA-binding transcriptional LysR family regulator [Umezawaea tangerina]
MTDAHPTTGHVLGSDLDLRLVGYFTVVAEHLNFGRAAAVLRVAQPSLSRQIQRLEEQLGVRLLDRTPQGSRLTEAGRVFLPRARALLDAAHEAALTARAAAPPHEISIGYVEDLVITPAVRELRHRHPDALVRTHHLDWTDALALPERRVDALVARVPLPFPTDRLRVTVLYDEPRVLLVPTSHRLAGKESISAGDLVDEGLVSCTGTAAAWGPPRSPEGGPAGPPVERFEDKLELVASGLAVAVVPAGDRRSTLRHDVTTVPIEDDEPYQVVLATRVDDPNPLVDVFRESARAHLTGAA